jgi:hypothetical protein
MATMTSSEAMARLEKSTIEVNAASNRLDRAREAQAGGAASTADVNKAKKDLEKAKEAAELAAATVRVVRRLEADEARERTQLAERLAAEQLRQARAAYTKTATATLAMLNRTVGDLDTFARDLAALELTIGRTNATFAQDLPPWKAARAALLKVAELIAREPVRFAR